MRSGFSTSACAAAAAAAALRALVSGQPVQQIVIDLPARRQTAFAIARCQIKQEGVCCGVIKDAGDDPDVTHGLEIQAVVRWSEESGTHLFGGKGVGIVTLPGLPVNVGEPAINPGPRKLILRVIEQERMRLNIPAERGLSITIQVPEGEVVAQQTMNPKLGIVGGISILGTDGLVRPYSAPAFRASLYYELRVARQNRLTTVALATGKRSAAYLKEQIGFQQELGVIEVGDDLGYPIDQAVKMGFEKIIIGGMIGKLSKLAQGRFQTHVNEGEVDFDFLAKIAGQQGAQPLLCERIRTARTAHQVQKWLSEKGICIESELAERAAEQVSRRIHRQKAVAVYLFSLKGDLLGYAQKESLR